MKRIILLAIIISCLSVVNLRAQFVDGTKGLLCMPSAEFEEDATFMVTNNYLRKEYLPAPTYYWGYDSFGYSFSVSLWSRLEISYSCVILDGKRNPNANSSYYKIMFNQDRHFAARVGITKDGEWGQKWLPAIAFGVSDPITAASSSGFQDYTDWNVSGNGNGFFNRFYIVASKKFDTSWGKISGHLGYQYSLRKDGMPTGPQAAVTWEPKWLNNSDWFMNNFRATLEWDARKLNFGINVSIWKNRFELMTMLFGM